MRECEDSQAKSGWAFLLGERLKGCVSCKLHPGSLPGPLLSAVIHIFVP